MQSRGEGNRQHIIEVATQLFHQQGYNQTSFRDIAQASGIPKGNFYYYFKTKDDLLESVVDQNLEDIRTKFQEWDQAFDKPVDRLKQLVASLGERSEDMMRYGCPIGSLNIELGKTNPVLKARAGEMFALLQSWSMQQFEFMGHTPREAENMALELLSRIQGVITVGNVLEDQAYILNQSHKIAAWLDQQQ
jgi:AcrR family transcriptional regulator